MHRFKSWTTCFIIFIGSGICFAQPVAQSDSENHRLQRARGARNARRALLAHQSVMFARARGPRALAPRQSFDTSADGVLHGPYFVRQVLTVVDLNSGDITRRSAWSDP